MEIIILSLDFVSNHHVGLGGSLVNALTHFTGIVDQFGNMYVGNSRLSSLEDEHGPDTKSESVR